MLKLRDLRKSKSLTLKQMAAIFGISESSISLYETGKRQPDYELLCKMADYFDVSIDTLMGRNSSDHESSDADLKFALFGDGNITDRSWKDTAEHIERSRTKSGQSSTRCSTPCACSLW